MEEQEGQDKEVQKEENSKNQTEEEREWENKRWFLSSFLISPLSNNFWFVSCSETILSFSHFEAFKAIKYQLKYTSYSGHLILSLDFSN